MPPRLDLQIESVAHGGDGIARHGGLVHFVPGGLPGDVVRARLVKRGKGFARAEIVEVVEPGPARREAGCPVFGTCGGCDWLHFAYPAQLEAKRRNVADCLSRIGGLDVAAEDITAMEDPGHRLGYRTRARFHGKDGRYGFYARGSRRVVDIDGCPLCHPHLNAVFAEARRAGFEGDLELTVHPGTGETLSSAEGGVFVCDGVEVRADAFCQSSLVLNRLLRRAVEEELVHARSVLDLFCGNGNFSATLPESTEVAGLDVSPRAVEGANRVRPGCYRVAPAGRFHEAIAARPWDAMLLDPPREGAADCAEALARCDAGAILYVSCEPSTLARDVKVLAAGGWGLARVTAVDMFPHTHHVETVARLERAGTV